MKKYTVYELLGDHEELRIKVAEDLTLEGVYSLYHSLATSAYRINNSFIATILEFNCTMTIKSLGILIKSYVAVPQGANNKDK